jgi:hypothetical protein
LGLMTVRILSSKWTITGAMYILYILISNYLDGLPNDSVAGQNLRYLFEWLEEWLRRIQS